MKIVQVVPRYPPRTGGVETHVKEVSERLVERGHDVTVLTADDGDDVATQEIRNGVAIRRYHGAAPSGAFHVAPGLLRNYKRPDADIVHAHNYHALPFFFAALRVDDERFVVTPHYHGGSASDLRNKLLKLYRPLGAWALRSADAVLAVSDWECEELSTDFDIGSTVVRNGIDIERFRGASPERRNTPYLLTVGRLEEYKGVQHAIQALTELNRYDLLVAGSGSYRDELEQIARSEGVAERIEFLGYVKNDRLLRLYAGADAYISLSAFESFGITVGEALAAGTPCVVRERGALKDWIGWEGCVGVAEVSPAIVATAVQEVRGLETDPDALPTWEDVVDKVERTYENIT